MGCGASASGPTTSGETGRKLDAKQADKEQNKDFQQQMAFLSKVPLFKRLPKDEIPLLVSHCVACHFKKGEVIIRQGELSAEFYVIQSGEASVTAQSSPSETPSWVAKLKSGDYFGEHALLREEPRTATITAEGDTVTLMISREKFKELGLTEKLQFANRKAVGAGGLRTLDTKPPSPKTPAEQALIKDALRSNGNLQALVMEDEEKVQAMCDVAWKETVPAGTAIITEGDLVADYFYIVQEGCFVASVEDAEAVPQSEEGAPSKGILEKGDYFGELALLYLVPRAATVKATLDSVVWVIDRLNFKNIMMKVSDQKIAEYVTYLDRVPILAPLLAEEKKAVAEALVEMHFAKSEIILQEGEPGSTFYILYEGEVSVSKDGVEQTRLTVGRGCAEAQIFGERALLNNEARSATVTVTSSRAKALALDRDAFDLLLGPLEEIIKRSQNGQKRASCLMPGGRFKATFNNAPREKIERKHLQRIGLLGCGGFGMVELYEHITTKETYALKSLSKGYIVKTGMQESVMNEKNILMMTNSPFIIRLYETYSGEKTLYFLLEPALGGELYATYTRRGFHGSERHAKFYVAGVIEGFQHMHQRRIIYRDLKPENLLLNDSGHLKITDMGLAKFVIGKTYTTCGTPDYFAPELIATRGHTNAVDWWTLGILIFELMSGHPPFEASSAMSTYAKVMKGRINWPHKIVGAVKDLIQALLVKEPSERLPMLKGGIQNLRDHAWYAGFHWEAFQALTMEPPYKPRVHGAKDLANFCAKREDCPRAMEYVDDGSGWDKDFAS
mmetsp:Transcript_1989/g.5368  ORF Transcript_1989/g.5368 Transcript_1989/m.5368 type:complete len:788 (-) Transcript_1989:173-2536(-)